MENPVDNIVDAIVSDLSNVASAFPVEYNGELHKAIMQQFDERALPFENILKDIMVKIFRQQRLEVIENLLRIEPKSYTKDYTDEIFDRDKWDEVIREDGGTAIRQIVETEGFFIGVQFGISFNVSSSNVLEFLNYKVFDSSIYNYPIMVNDTTENMLRTLLSEGLSEGLTMRELARNLDSVFNFAETDRAMRIARTETTGAMNFADNEGYKQTGFVKAKRWLATLDDRVRDSHSKLHNAVAKIGEKFKNGLEYPGDSRAGKPEETVNCRCTTIAVLPI